MLILKNGAYPFLLTDEEHFAGQCRIDAYMASGRGGQKRNRIYSAVRATHLPTGISVIAEESRSQLENRKRALRRLRTAIALRARQERWEHNIHPSITYLFGPDARDAINPKNPLYPLFCATVLDALYREQGKISAAAAALGISTGRMNKFLSSDKDLFTAANTLRAFFNLKPLTVMK